MIDLTRVLIEPPRRLRSWARMRLRYRVNWWGVATMCLWVTSFFCALAVPHFIMILVRNTMR